MQDVLDLPVIDAKALDAEPPVAPKTDVATAASTVVDLTKFDLTDVALAHFGDWKGHIKTVEKTLTGLVLDVSTTTKLTEAKSLRARLIGTPLAEKRKISEALKSKLTKVSKAVGAELTTIEAEFTRVTELISPTITKREEEIEAEKQKELDRKAQHGANIAKIRGYGEGCESFTAERLGKGVAYVEALVIDPAAWEEFAELAEKTKADALAALKALHAKAVEAEHIAKEHAAQQLALAIAQRAMACVGKPSATVRDELNLLELTVYPEDTSAVVTDAHAQAVAQLKMLLTMAELQESQLAAQKAAQATSPITPNTQSEKQYGSLPAAAGACASTEPEAAQGSGSGDEGKAAHAEERAAEPTFTGVIVHGGSSFVRESVAPMAIDDRSIETSEADAIEPASLVLLPDTNISREGEALLAAHHCSADERLLSDCLAFVRHAELAFTGTKFPTQPKPGVEWWAALKGGCDALARRLVEAGAAA